MTLFILVGLLGVSAQSEPIGSGSASAGGWYVTAPGVGTTTLNPSVSASYPCGQPTCENSASLVDQSVGDPLAPIATADLLFAEAQAFQNPDATATLQQVIEAAADPSWTVPTQWNTRGYARVEGFSALNRSITATSIEAETVFGTATSGGVSASGVRIVGLQLAGALTGQELAPIQANLVNQVLFDQGGIRIVYWETNWDPRDGSTTDGQPVWVNALHITDSLTGADITLSVASTDATFPPVARDDAASTPPGTAVVIDVDANDSDADGDLDRSSVTITQPPTNGTVTCDNTGACTYTPRAGFSGGTDTFTYRICDSTGACDTATVTITVTPPPPPGNDPPVANNDSATTRIDDPVVVNVTANDSDPEGNLVQTSVSVTQQPTNGDVDCVNNLCTYTPNANFVGTDTFTYQVCDNVNQCDTATVTITVTNAPPVATDDAATTTQGSSVTVAVTGNDRDIDGNLVPSSATVTRQPANGVVICSNGSCTYTPDTTFSGTDTFEYRVCDSKNLCDTAIVTVTVDPAPGGGPPTNQPPTAVDDNASTNVGTSVDVNVLLNDSDADGTIDPSSVAVMSGPSNGSVICSNGTCTYTPQAGFSGIDSFVYRVCDDDSACATATVTINVSGQAPAGANQPPVAVDDARSTDHDTAVTLNVLNNDSDEDGNLVQSASVTMQPGNGSVVCNGGSCTYSPQPGFSGTDIFDYRVCDSDNACDTARVTITVAAPPGGGGPVNQPPVANDDTSNTAAGAPVAIDVTRNDSDPDNNLSDTVTVINHPDNGAVICDQDECTYTPATGFSGTDSFDYRICDTTNACDTATVTITVAPAPNNPPAPPANNPPVATNDSVTTPGGSSVTITVLPNDSDPDGNLDGSTVAITRQPDHGAVICSNGTCTYTPEPGYSGPDSFEYRVCDTANACDTATVNVIVGPSAPTDNEPPVAEDDTVTTRPGRPVVIDVTDNDSDPEGDLDETTVAVVDPPEHGSVICNSGSCTYTPEGGYSGSDSFEYRVCDDSAACTTAVVTITIPAPNTDVDSGDGGGPGYGPGNGGPGYGPGNGGPGNGGSGPGDPDQDGDGDPAPGGDDDPAPSPPNAPISLDSPLLGAPNAPLPFTGGEPSFYLGAALNLLVIGMILLLIARFTGASRKPCPAWHNHEEAREGHGCAYGEWS